MASASGAVNRHFVAWIPHKRPVGAPILDNPLPITTRAFRPTAHITGQLGLTKLVRKGDIIWLVGSFPLVRRPEASFDGRIVVANVRKDGKKLIFEADNGSAWLPWVDIRELLYGCQFMSQRGPIRLVRHLPLGQQLRFTRQLCLSSAVEVEKFAKAVLRRRSLFVSYRWAESSDVVAALLPILSALGYAVWWDRWSGPRRLEEESAPPPELARMIELAITNVSTALIVVGPSYYKGLWTAHEYKEITRRRIPKIEVPDCELRRLVLKSDIQKSFGLPA